MSITTTTAPGSAPQHPSPFTLKNITIALFVALLGAGGLAKRDEVGAAMADAARRMTQLELWGLSMKFNAATIDTTVRADIFAHLDEKAKASVAQRAQMLNNFEVVRLLNVGLLDKLCDYELGTGQMRQDFESDRRLRDLGLAKIEIDDTLKAAVLREVTQREAKEKSRSDIGYPRLCYRLTLTDAGRDVRTALIYAYAQGFAKAGG